MIGFCLFRCRATLLIGCLRATGAADRTGLPIEESDWWKGAKEIERLQALIGEVRRLRAALEFYAAEHTDDGESARAALLARESTGDRR